ncbi:MAG TPA: hypothetical protein VK116_00820, partial [Planctomycetota bacterium]|nr:hypothetical protein [Planctomycetota bacterium]
IEFIGHAHLARGEFGAAYELYRAAASKGWVVEPALDLARARLGDIVRHDHQIPGLAAVIEATCPRVRGSVLSELVPIEALAGRPARLREVDRVLLDFVAKTKPSERSEPPRSIIAAYLVETGRGFELSSARLDRGRTDDAERRAIADDLCRVADPVLRECELEAEGDAFVLTANGERERSAMRGAVDLARAANSILERVGSDLRFAARRLPYGGEALLCMREQAIARISN